MHGIAVFKKGWVLALLAVVVISAIVGGVSFFRWYTGRSLGSDGRQDSCGAVKVNDNLDWIAAPDSSPSAMKRILAQAPTFSRDPAFVPAPGTPVLVHPFGMHTGYDFNDCPHWLLPEYDPAGHLVEIADYVYDYPHKRVRFANAGEIMPNEPRYRNPYPYLLAEQAEALLKRTRGVDTRGDPAPELVFLPLDMGLPEQPGPAAHWQGGGATPGDPVWLLAGADGQDYVIGTDRHVYTLHDIPLS